jgi:hypothetical protein
MVSSVLHVVTTEQPTDDAGNAARLRHPSRTRVAFSPGTHMRQRIEQLLIADIHLHTAFERIRLKHTVLETCEIGIRGKNCGA